MRRPLIRDLAVVVACVSATAAGASEPVEPLEGLDPVLLVEGREVQGEPELTADLGRFRYSFAGPESRERFLADPERYAVRYGGACARMPGANGNPDLFLVHDGAIYLFGSAGCREAFAAAPEAYLEPPPPPLPDDPAALARGAELLERAAAALGGERLDRLTSYRERGLLAPPAAGGDELAQVKSQLFPHHARLDQQAPFGEISSILCADSLYQVFDERVERRLDAHRDRLERELRREPVALVRSRHVDGFRAAAAGAGTVDGRPVERVEIDWDGDRVLLSLDAESHRPLAVAYTDRGPDHTVGRVETLYEEYRQVDGLWVPFRSRSLFDGEPFPGRDYRVESVSLDPELPPELFAPPAPAAGG